MRVLYFHQHFSTPEGAAGLRAYIMGRRLLERGHRVTVVCGSYRGGDTGLRGPFTRGVRRGSVDGIDVVEFDLRYANMDSYPRRVRTFLTFALRAIRLALTERYDLVFATSAPLTAGLPGIFGRWFRGKPFVFEVRDLWPALPRAMGVITNPLVLGSLNSLEWLTYRSAHRLIGLAPGIVDGIAIRGVGRDRIALIPNMSDLDLFRNRSPSWRPDGIAASDLMAVFAGTHGKANGLDAVLDAAAVLRERGNTDIKIVLVGDGASKPALVAKARAERLDSIVFCDPATRARIAGLFAASDIGLQVLANVSAFYDGTSPNKFFDYLAAGLPVLTNYPGWVADMISTNAIGHVVPPADPTAFANALERAEADRAALAAMGRRALVLAEARFDSRHLSDRFVDWLEETDIVAGGA
ncbi:glycosyltransferase family 4 protein [Bauldia litoralis]|uniref:Glycosyltransferase involved in cell wall bisynthesis n=1 Tax=Bauldia litoralis TaxID=665467 RepID=A0A1G6CVC7_9HYPH|nr:glycosyltransferase family 4 protein [Bauldia litoralis]SDB36810.1 Glycosyltransferase involved in cell wall bisynthesis [Bauldia litoralis]